MQVRCPDCRSPVEFDSASSFDAIKCTACGRVLNLIGTDDTATLAVQTRIMGHFQLVELLGVGHFGSVWKAKDTELDRWVAVKVPRKLELTEAETASFLREAQAAAALRHPHIMTVFEVGRCDGTIFIVTELIEGGSLSQWLRQQPLPPQEAARLALDMARALAHAHGQGVIHRDLKSSNILLDREQKPYMADFGLARREKFDITMTMDGQIIGTPAYMSPEQARGDGHRADRRSDIYSLGVVLYEMLTGELPFRGMPHVLYTKIIGHPPPSLRSVNPRVPRDLETVCLKCLEKSPDSRYDSATDLADELQRYLEGRPVLARPVGRLEQFWRWYRRHPQAAVMTAGGYSVLLGTQLLVWIAIGLVMFAIGLHRAARAQDIMNGMVVASLVVYLPALVFGVKTLNGSRAFLWAGTVIYVFGALLTTALICRTIELSWVDAFGDSSLSQFAMLSLLAILAMFGLVLHVVALLTRSA